jgi:hypothetical protein
VSQGRDWIGGSTIYQNTKLTVSVPSTAALFPNQPLQTPTHADYSQSLPVTNWSIFMHNSTTPAKHLITQIDNYLSRPPPISEFVYCINTSLVFWHARSQSNSDEYCTMRISSPHQHSLPRPSIKMSAWQLIVLRERAFLQLDGTTIVEWVGNRVSNTSSSDTWHVARELYSTQQTRWFRQISTGLAKHLPSICKSHKTCSYTSNWYPLTTDSCIVNNSAGSLSQPF